MRTDRRKGDGGGRPYGLTVQIGRRRLTPPDRRHRRRTVGEGRLRSAAGSTVAPRLFSQSARFRFLRVVMHRNFDVFPRVAADKSSFYCRADRYELSVRRCES